MKINRFIIVPLIITLLFSLITILFYPDRALGQMTIPTRTPVPDSPTDPPPKPTKDDDDDPPPATDTPQPSDTPDPSATLIYFTYTPTTTATLQSPTPTGTITPTSTATMDALSASATATALIGEQINKMAPGTTPVPFPEEDTPFPTAEPCGEPPTLTTLTTTKVYEGPGSDYPVSETLRAKEVRPIVGRAANATWWLIQLDSKFTQAWISDGAGTVQGFIGNVPIVEAPAIDGALPTPGEPWDPTPAPVCTPTPSPTSDDAVISGSVDLSSSSSELVNTASENNVAAI